MPVPPPKIYIYFGGRDRTAYRSEGTHSLRSLRNPQNICPHFNKVRTYILGVVGEDQEEKIDRRQSYNYKNNKFIITFFKK